MNPQDTKMTVKIQSYPFPTQIEEHQSIGGA
jgi:hypothetical protein